MFKTYIDPKVYEKGKVEGVLEGEIKGKIESIADFLSDLDDFSEEIQERMFAKEPNIETLKVWTKYAKKVESVNEFITLTGI